MSYIAEIDARIAGIPCKVGVTHYLNQAGNSRADSDWDYYGYTEIEYDVLDRKGRKAPWLERKVTEDDVLDIESSIIKYFDEEAEYDY